MLRSVGPASSSRGSIVPGRARTGCGRRPLSATIWLQSISGVAMDRSVDGASPDQAAFDRDLRLFVYRHFVAEGSAPTAGAAAEALSCSEADAHGGYRRLAAARVLVLQPGGTE